MSGALIAGFVEAVTDSALLGWAWQPGAPELRVAIDLVLDGAVIAQAIADRPREDLTRNGVGDGAHAFAAEVPAPHRARIAEIGALARAGDQVLRLGAPPAPEPLADRLDRLQRGLEAVIGSQRVLHRTVQAALVGERGSAPDAQDALVRQIATLEVFVARLDERLAALAPPPLPPAATAPWPMLAAGLAVLISLVGLLRSLPG